MAFPELPVLPAIANWKGFQIPPSLVVAGFFFEREPMGLRDREIKLSGPPPKDPVNRGAFFRKAIMRGQVGCLTWFKLANGQTENIFLKVLSAAETNAAEVKAMQWLKSQDIELTKSVFDSPAFIERVKLEILLLAVCQAEESPGNFHYPEFITVDEIQNALTKSEVTELFSLYDGVVSEFEPNYESLIEDNFDLWTEYLSKAPEEDGRLFLARIAWLLPEVVRILCQERHIIYQSLDPEILRNILDSNQRPTLVGGISSRIEHPSGSSTESPQETANKQMPTSKPSKASDKETEKRTKKKDK